jgi:hypothetical protein
MREFYKDFPYDHEQYATYDEAVQAGYDHDQIWSVVESIGDFEEVFTYGPPNHIVNRLFYVATVERHDCETYYHEVEPLR